MSKAPEAIPTGRLRRRSSLVLVAVLTVLVTGCLGGDFRSMGLSVEKWDHGWLVAIEPDEEFQVHLLGSNAHPGQQWRLVEFDTQVLRLAGEEHETPRAEPGERRTADGGESDPGPTTGSSGFRFVGVDIGRTPLRFELVADARRVDVAEYTVDVVDDACAAGTAAVANRCGGDGFTYQPQMLQERSYGEQAPVQVGATARLVLTANALHQDSPWEVVRYDDDIIAVEGPVSLGAARAPGDFSAVDLDTSHSFLPAWEFTITGLTPGRTTLLLELTSAGQPLDAFVLEVVVTQD